jgi:hypothetical protein
MRYLLRVRRSLQAIRDIAEAGMRRVVGNRAHLDAAAADRVRGQGPT